MKTGSFLPCPSGLAVADDAEASHFPGNDGRSPRAENTPALPTRIGRYRIIRLIAEGGTGQVWLAEQIEPVKPQVALNLIKPGQVDTAVLQRFHSERQSLAITDHPSIAKVFDAGVTPDGQPYFVMNFPERRPNRYPRDGYKVYARKGYRAHSKYQATR